MAATNRLNWTGLDLIPIKEHLVVRLNKFTLAKPLLESVRIISPLLLLNKDNGLVRVAHAVLAWNNEKASLPEPHFIFPHSSSGLSSLHIPFQFSPEPLSLSTLCSAWCPLSPTLAPLVARTLPTETSSSFCGWSASVTSPLSPCLSSSTQWETGVCLV